jgi:hypothetical protein
MTLWGRFIFSTPERSRPVMAPAGEALKLQRPLPNRRQAQQQPPGSCRGRAGRPTLPASTAKLQPTRPPFG